MLSDLYLIRELVFLSEIRYSIGYKEKVISMLVFELEDHTNVRLKKGEAIQGLLKERADYEEIYAIIIDGKLHDLNYCPQSGGALSFVYANSETGRLIYERTLSFVFIAAINSLYPNTPVTVEHALSSGLYCSIKRKPFLTPHDVDEIRNRMDEIIKENAEIKRTVMDTTEAVKHFEAIGMKHKSELLKCRKSKQSSVYSLFGSQDYFYGILLPHAGYIKRYTLRFYAPGVWLSAQNGFEHQSKLFKVFQEFEAWGKSIGVSNVAELNQRLLDGKMDELVLMCETMLEKKLGTLAESIIQEKPNTRFILIAGPSSAGKTTFSRRLAIHLKILGLQPYAISMDDFYKNREDSPRLSDGSYDFECVEALDLDLFNETMLKLLHHTPVHMPRFNFMTGKQEKEETETVLDEKQILIIEGIHGLNPNTSAYLPSDSIFKIYINALTHLNLDEHNRIPTSDYRLIRRIVRDHCSRGWSAADTISFWKNVKHGEEQYIYPYQEDADAIFNTSMVYELAILKKLAIPLLQEVKKNRPEYLEANRLSKLLAYFVDGESDAIPRYSILAEFVGNSILDVS